MNFSIQRPSAVYGLIVLIPALIYTVSRYRNLLVSLKVHSEFTSESHAFVRMKRCFLIRTVCRVAAWLMLVAAYAGISWGVNTVPVQKSGRAVAMVFDISYSMLAKDGPDSMTRLEAACSYSEELLSRLKETSVSVSLAKGDGIVSIPMTEDYNAVSVLLSELSPNLLTSQGSSLGGGIKAAVSSFPRQSSTAGYIWLFTDGEETDATLMDALSDAVRRGFPVAIIGFGNERESEVTAGDGTTKIKTALRSTSISSMIETLARKNSNGTNSLSLTPVTYLDASESGSASRLLKMLSRTKGISDISYEVYSIERHGIFVALAIVFFILSFIAGEIDFTSAVKRFSRVHGVLLLVTLFTSCSPRFHDGRLLFEGKLDWNRKNYQGATACFLAAADDSHKRGDSITEEYALCNLATTYLMQDENEIALKKFQTIIDNTDTYTDSRVQFAAYYNSGIIAHRQGNYEKAVDFFKSALLIDSTSTAAKINLELSLQESSMQKRSQTESELNPVSETDYDSTLETAVYSIIKEEEKNRWKSLQQQSTGSSLDY